MTIRYNRRYRDLPDVGSAAYQASKGIAHDARYAQTLAHNVNYAMAHKAAPVISSGFDGTLNTWYGKDDGTELLGFRGRGILWPPFKDLTLNVTARYRAIPGIPGTLKLYLTDSPWTNDKPGNSDKSATITIDAPSYTEYSVTITDAPVAGNLMVYAYTLLTYCEVESWILYAEPYEPEP